MQNVHDSEVVLHRYVEADGVRVFYREAGDPSLPALLLVHGFPTSSHMFRRLFAELSCSFHLIAPDLPGFGLTEVPESRNYQYSFDSLAKTLEAFIDALGIRRYILYVFDYGAPVGLRLAADRPESVAGLISQNANAYLVGLSDAWAPIRNYWEQPTIENRNSLRSILSLDGIRWQYEHGVPDGSVVAPEAYLLDHMFIGRPGNDETQLDLILDYRSNLDLYPRFQDFFRRHRPRTLVIWGRNDPFFLPAGAEAYRQDNPEAAVELLDTGHFALETHGKLIAGRIQDIFAHPSNE